MKLDAKRAYEAWTRACGYEITHLRNWDLITDREKAAWSAALEAGVQRSTEATITHRDIKPGDRVREALSGTVRTVREDGYVEIEWESEGREWWNARPKECLVHVEQRTERTDQATPKGMLPEKVREAFAASRALLPADLPALRHAPDWRQHIVFMCEEGSSYVEGRREKAMRWLGFVQGALWAHGLAPIEDLKNMNRPEPHHLDKATKAPGEST